MCRCTHTKVYSKLYCKVSFLLILSCLCDKIQALVKLPFEKDQKLKMEIHSLISLPLLVVYATLNKLQLC